MDATPICPECGTPMTSTGNACGTGVCWLWWACERCGHEETTTIPNGYRRRERPLAQLTPREKDSATPRASEPEPTGPPPENPHQGSRL